MEKKGERGKSDGKKVRRGGETEIASLPAWCLISRSTIVLPHERRVFNYKHRYSEPVVRKSNETSYKKKERERRKRKGKKK